MKRSGKSVARYILYSIAFLAGFAVMGYEILGARVLFPLYGNSVYVWGAIISVFLAGLSIGYAAGGRLADMRPDVQTLSRLLLIPSIIIVLFPFYGPAVCRIFEAMKLESRIGSLLVSAILFMVPCIFMGAIVPFIVKILATESGKVGSSAGNVFSISTAGSIAGTLFTSFFLISWMPVTKGIQLLGIVVASCCFLCMLHHRIRCKNHAEVA